MSEVRLFSREEMASALDDTLAMVTDMYGELSEREKTLIAAATGAYTAFITNTQGRRHQVMPECGPGVTTPF